MFRRLIRERNIPIIVTGLDKPIDELRVELDIIPPQVTITPGSIINGINHGNYQIAGTCDEVDGTVVLDVGDIAVEAICDGNGYVADQIDLSGLDAAVAEVSVTADLKDKLGNPAPQATVSLIRDIIPPGSVTIDTPAIISEDVINSYSLSGGCAEDGTGVVIIKIAGLDDLTADCTNRQSWNFDVPSSELLKLPEQEDIAVVIEHRDSAGNVVSISSSLDKDTTPPVLAITSGLLINIANQNTYELNGDCSENGRDVSITLGSNAVVAVSCSDGDWTHSPNVGEGSSSVSITHSDAAGNTGTLISPDPLVKDTIAPTFDFVSDLDINADNEGQYYVSGTCSEAGDLVVAVDKDSFQHTQTVPCNNGSWMTSAIDVSAIPSTSPVSVELTAGMTDAADNPAAQQKSKTVRKDTTSRSVAIDRLSGDPDKAPPINLDNVASYQVAGSCSDQAGDVTVTVGGTAEGTGACSGERWTATVNASTVSDGTAVAVSASFGSGSEKVSDATTAIKDTIAPQVTITTPLAAITVSNFGSYPLSGTCTFGDGQLTVAVGTATPDGTVDCLAEGTWSASVNVSSLENGTLDVTASQTDTLGNRGDDSESITKTIDDIVVSAGDLHTCALKPNGQVACWGAGNYGQLGNGGTSTSSSPVDVRTSSSDTAALSGIAAISSGYSHTCALTTGGKVKCWGYGNSGRLGNGGTTNSSTPVDVQTSSSDTAALSGIAAISSGSRATPALSPLAAKSNAGEMGTLGGWAMGGRPIIQPPWMCIPAQATPRPSVVLLRSALEVTTPAPSPLAAK